MLALDLNMNRECFVAEMRKVLPLSVSIIP